VSAGPFDIREVETAIASTVFAGRLHHLSSVPSTNDLALAAAQAGARSGVWIADEQTAGRGRGAHRWHSTQGAPQEPAGIYMSALVAPAIPLQSALRLSFRVAIAVQSAIASTTGFRIRDEIDIRWPNDLLLKGRKCGGILIETSAQRAPAIPSSPAPAMLRHAVIGIGINVNHTSFPPELQTIATSLRRESPDPTQPLRREPFVAAILITLDEALRELTTSNRQPATNNNFAEYSSWISGKRVRVESRDPTPSDPTPGYTGITAGLDAQGFLLVAGDDGELHTALSGGLREP